MRRRDFLCLTGATLAAASVVPALSGTSPSDLRNPQSSGSPQETSLWIHGSPYLGHSDLRPSLRGLTPEEARLEIAHFRTDEPWRRKILFQL